jgi:hypothetical protein
MGFDLTTDEGSSSDLTQADSADQALEDTVHGLDGEGDWTAEDGAIALDTGSSADVPVVSEDFPLCINEFMPSNVSAFAIEEGVNPDWIELHNPTDTDVPLDGWYLSDNRDDPEKHMLDGGLVVASEGFILLFADSQPELGPEHLSFSLDAGGEDIVLQSPTGEVSMVGYGAVADDLSAARVTDCCEGSGCWTFVANGSPGLTNVEPVIVDEIIFDAGNAWRYFDRGEEPTGWKSVGYDDSDWSSGDAPLGYGDDWIMTELSYGPDDSNKYVTIYYRRTFDVADVSQFTALEIGFVYDDGGIAYLNETEIARGNMPVGDVSYDTWAIQAESEGVFFLYGVDVSLLVEGENTITVEIHQTNGTSSDTSFDMFVQGQRFYWPDN